jgi:hypothetical protein
MQLWGTHQLAVNMEPRSLCVERHYGQALADKLRADQVQFLSCCFWNKIILTISSSSVGSSGTKHFLLLLSIYSEGQAWCFDLATYVVLSEIESREEQRYFLLHAIQPSIQSSGVKRPVVEADHSLLISTQVKNAWDVVINSFMA